MMNKLKFVASLTVTASQYECKLFLLWDCFKIDHSPLNIMIYDMVHLWVRTLMRQGPYDY